MFRKQRLRLDSRADFRAGSQIRAAQHQATDDGGTRTRKTSHVCISTAFRLPSYGIVRRVQTYYLLSYSLTPYDCW